MDNNKIILKPGLEGVPVTNSSICDIDGKKLEKISKKFFNLKSNRDKSAFLYSKVDIKNGNSNKMEYFSDLQDLNFLIRNILKISNEESLEIIKQTIPEKNPILYTETKLKIL